MGQVNLYKIDDNKKQLFLGEVGNKLNRVSEKSKTKSINNQDIIFTFTLYVSPEPQEQEVSWKWVHEAFGITPIKSTPNPKSILLVKREECLYAITFGFSYFMVDKFCDRNFAFKFARKIRYKEIKTTALTSPNARRNKIINTYLNYNDFEFDSGESFTKIKIKALIEDNFTIYNESIEIGSSIKFSLPQNSFESIVNLLIYIENVIETREDIYKIPIFSKVIDSQLIQSLDERLSNEVFNNPLLINISELDIVGATEVFNHNDTTFKVSYNNVDGNIDELSYEKLQNFAEANEFNLNEHLLELKVVSYNDGNPVRTDLIKNLIDYTDDAERCILSKGLWYHFNDDYLNYLSDSLKELEVIYISEYNFNRSAYTQFIDEKFVIERNETIYNQKTPAQIKECLRNKYYAERYYNIMLSERHGFVNYDRIETRIGNADIELMDLYKDNTMFAVKKGKSSEKLCYVVDQSLQSLKAYKHNLAENKPHIENVAILLVLERSNHLQIIDGKPNINQLEMLMLKNKLDSWKKEVRLSGYKPVVYINYVE